MAKKGKGIDLSERAKLLLGDAQDAHIAALESFSKLLIPALKENEKRFSDEEWYFLGKIMTQGSLVMLPSAVPLAVVLEHSIDDMLALDSDETTAKLASGIVTKLKKLSLLESFALTNTLQFLTENSESLGGKQWWLLSTRSPEKHTPEIKKETKQVANA